MSWLFGEISSGTTPDSKDAEFYGGDINWVTTSELRERAIAETSQQLAPAALASYSALKVYPPGTLLIAMYGATIGRLGWLERPACTNQACCAFANPLRVETRFAYYSLIAARDHLVFLASGGGQPNINQDKLRSLRIAVPSRDEQATIVEFLDRETDKIDALIAKQEQLIATLLEDRTATITHAVTKGLDPNVELKESGVECIGPLPSTWSVRRLKSLGSIQYGIGEPPKYVETGTPLIRATNISKGAILSEGLVYVNPDDIPAARIYWLKEGDILVVRSGAYTGDSAIVLNEYSGAIAGFDMVFRAASVVPMFVQYVLLSAYCKDAQIDIARARAAQPHLNAEELGNCLIVIPPVDIQESIVSFLNARCSKIDALIAKAGNVIQTLREYRSALITHAVTGKIDVREAVA
jgi:type I restriction enzyme S subunit